MFRVGERRNGKCWESVSPRPEQNVGIGVSVSAEHNGNIKVIKPKGNKRQPLRPHLEWNGLDNKEMIVRAASPSSSDEWWSVRREVAFHLLLFFSRLVMTSMAFHGAEQKHPRTDCLIIQTCHCAYRLVVRACGIGIVVVARALWQWKWLVRHCDSESKRRPCPMPSPTFQAIQ